MGISFGVFLFFLVLSIISGYFWIKFEYEDVHEKIQKLCEVLFYIFIILTLISFSIFGYIVKLKIVKWSIFS